METAALDFFEQPVAGHDLAGMARVAGASRIPIGFDEGLHGIADLARNRGWTITGLQVERGRLDDVFREITTAPAEPIAAAV